MSAVVPVGPDEMTPAWVEQVFGATPGSLVALEHAPVGTGQVCDSYRFECTWRNGALPASFVAKCPSADPVSRAGAWWPTAPRPTSGW